MCRMLKMNNNLLSIGTDIYLVTLYIIQNVLGDLHFYRYYILSFIKKRDHLFVTPNKIVHVSSYLIPLVREDISKTLKHDLKSNF